MIANYTHYSFTFFLLHLTGNIKKYLEYQLIFTSVSFVNAIPLVKGFTLITWRSLKCGRIREGFLHSQWGRPKCRVHPEEKTCF